MSKRSIIKLLSILIIMSLIILSFSSCGKDENTNESPDADSDQSSIDTTGMSFKLNEDGQSYTITGLHNCSMEDGTLTIPDKYNNLPVTKIGPVANGMGDSTIKKLILPDTIEIIESRAFMSSTSLQTIVFGSGLKVIEYGAFQYCNSLTEITIPSSVTFLGAGAFKGCAQLKKVVLSSSLEMVYSTTFSECEALETLEMPKSDTQYMCKNNCLINTDTKTLIFGCKNSIIPQDMGIKCISAFAFSGCKDLKAIALPNTLQVISDSAFSNCTSLESLTIPKSVNSIDSGAFLGCINLQSVSVEDGSVLQYIGAGAFSDCSELNSITIPSSVKKIGEDVFSDCTSLKGTNYNSAIYLGNVDNPYVLLLETTNRDVVTCTIHEDTKFISSLAFVNCKQLESVTLPEGLLGIGGYAFAGCPIKNFKLPTSVEYLGEMPFSIGFDGEAVKDPDFTVLTQYDNAYYVGSLENPYMVLVRVVNTNIISCRVHANTKMIYSYAFGECDKLTNVVFESDHNLKRIGETAFSGCSALSTLNIPSSVDSIGWYAFDGCGAVSVEDDVFYVDNWAVGSNLAVSEDNHENKTITIKKGIVGIASGAFGESPTCLILPQSLRHIGENCFNSIIIEKIYYYSSESDFERLFVDYGNSEFMNARIYYYSETQPQYWHMVDGVPTEWK